MEYAVYQVSEDEGSVEVCAVMHIPPDGECPVDFLVSVTLSTSDGTAGNISILEIACLYSLRWIALWHNIVRF